MGCSEGQGEGELYSQWKRQILESFNYGRDMISFLVLRVTVDVTEESMSQCRVSVVDKSKSKGIS